MSCTSDCGVLTFFCVLDRTAKRLLTEIVEKGRPAPSFHHNDGPGSSVQEIMVPASKAGLVIGKGGETIKQLQVRPQRSVHCFLNVQSGLNISVQSFIT